MIKLGHQNSSKCPYLYFVNCVLLQSEAKVRWLLITFLNEGRDGELSLLLIQTCYSSLSRIFKILVVPRCVPSRRWFRSFYGHQSYKRNLRQVTRNMSFVSLFVEDHNADVDRRSRKTFLGRFKCIRGAKVTLNTKPCKYTCLPYWDTYWGVPFSGL